ncbi:hypothetical protein PCC9214_02119 [Planktothrix tepida]|uniref:Uncharacterized protein n=1 Tax=Planktothrix tepida PCC 9214 TaxID=671072 RepID=A0A1J1LKB2_9CYAN|nr:IS1634 family transposase [Planktothrix tepida]CAD5944043.1 hypothetical protein PCC9214_02119 [Planktothrix tepida]CUR32915.1 conserved hypothetical protein [Planktothrix tepida PCC 9214]
MKNPLEAMEIVNLDHLGIVAGIKEEGNQEEEEEMKAIKIVHGYSRDKRPDLKQFIIDMVVSGDGDVPLYLKIDDGNADDKSVFVERLKEFTHQWTFEGICVADSALYTAENIGAMAGMKWITRVPLSLKEAQNKIVEIEEEEWVPSKIIGYKIATKSSEYGNSKQRWLVVESEIRKKAAIKKISEQVEKQLENAKAALRKLSKQEYACIADAEIGIKMLSDSWIYHEIKEIKCTEKANNKSQSKTKKGNKEKTIVYQVTGEIEARESVIEGERIKAGRFILATNILDKEEVRNQVKKITNKPTMRWIFKMFQAVHLVKINGEK